MKSNFKNTTLLSIVGKSIFVCASGLAGFIIGGPVGASLGVIAGALGSHLLQKGLKKCPL